jgi:hypothetical protein
MNSLIMKKYILNKNKLLIFIELIVSIFLLNFFSQNKDTKINFEELPSIFLAVVIFFRSTNQFIYFQF